MTTDNRTIKDVLLTAIDSLLTRWDAEDQQERNDLSDEFWEAMRVLRAIREVIQ